MMPVGIKVGLKFRGKKMYDFLGSLNQFVLSLKVFDGIRLPPASARKRLQESGVISMG